MAGACVESALFLSDGAKVSDSAPIDGAFDAGDGVVASVSVFEDRAGLEETERRLEGWIEETVERFNIEPGAVSEGPAFATSASG